MEKAVTKEHSNVPFFRRYTKVCMSRTVKTINILMMSISVAPSVLADSPSITFAVSGKIVPNSCTVEAPQGGDYDFGDISHTLLSSSETKLPAKAQTWEILCDGQTYLMVSSVDNQQDSVTYNSYNSFGLGFNGEGKVGYYTALISDLSVDGQPAKAGGYTGSAGYPDYSIHSPSDRSFHVYDEVFFPSKNGMWIAWAAAKNTLYAGQKFSADITIQPILARNSDFGDVTTDVSLQGSMTMNFSFGI
ncbi:DUF1120 domain-containing protein [Vibrio sp. NH-UV-68]|uniref:DUF1120 domain-containing protein n=1 Tax=unclassified Vibrio TaxID=2614977 RepID=UPI0036F3D08B